MNFKSSLVKQKPDAEILSEQWIPLGVTDYSKNIPVILADRPEIVVTNLWGESLAQFIRQLKPTGPARQGQCDITFRSGHAKIYGRRNA